MRARGGVLSVMLTRFGVTRHARRLILPVMLAVMGGALSGCVVAPAYPGYAGPVYYGPYAYPNVAVRGVFVWRGR